MASMDTLAYDSDCDDDHTEAEQWGGWEDPEQVLVFHCLFTDATFPTYAQAAAAMKAGHGLDLAALGRDLSLDFHRYVRLVNHIRKTVKATNATSWQEIAITSDAAALTDDALLAAVLPDDAFLMHDPGFDDDEEDEDEDIAVLRQNQSGSAPTVETLAKELAEMRLRFTDYRKTAEDKLQAATAEELEDTGNDSYFASYSHFGIHLEMLQDEVRTENYRKAIVDNKAAFKGKVVLDVGCGTGILSMFAAEAGAAHVYGVDMSSTADEAVKIIKDNGLEDKITIIKGKVEEITLPVEKVDIIISEWMGYFLLFESMLDTVLVARDRWLKEGGLVLPDQSSIYIVGTEDKTNYDASVTYWNNVYGRSMKCMKRLVLGEGQVKVVDKECRMTQPAMIKSINSEQIKVDEVAFKSPFTLVASRDGHMDSITGYFDTVFERGLDETVFFSTGPEFTPTHWKQTVFLFDEPVAMSKGDHLVGTLECKRNLDNPRSLDVEITYAVEPLGQSDASSTAPRTQQYRI